MAVSSGDHVVAIPCFNDTTKLGDVIRGAQQYFRIDRIVVVDDGSVPPLQDSDVCGAVLLRHEENRGLSAAVNTAVRFALTMGADGLIKVDADGQMDSDALPRFRAALNAGYEVVLGTFDPKQTPASVRFVDGLFRFFFWLGTGSRVPTLLAEYRAYGPGALRVLANGTSIPGWASPLTLFDLRGLRSFTVSRCVRFFEKHVFPTTGMLQLRVMFIRCLLRHGSVRAMAAAPIAAAVLFAHMGCVLAGRAVEKKAVRIQASVRAIFSVRR